MQAGTIGATPRYGFAPQVMFAATRASAERQARERAAAVAANGTQSPGRQSLIRTLAAHLTGSTS